MTTPYGVRPVTSAPGDSVAEGNQSAAARADHKHGREAADANYSGTPTTSAVGDSAAVGASTTGSRSDHKHGREAYETAPAAVAAVASAGTATTVSHGDHVHADVAFSAWTSYTPAWTSDGTQPAIGNGSLQGYYKTIGKTLHVRVYMLCGSTTTFGTGGYHWSIPGGLASVNTISAVGTALAQISTAGKVGAAFLPANSTTIQVNANNDEWGPSNPAVWANGSQMNLSLTCEIA